MMCKKCIHYKKDCINLSKRVLSKNCYGNTVCLNFKLNIHYKWSDKENKQFLKQIGCDIND